MIHFFVLQYNALEPVISAEIMQLHHSKHHAAYVTNLNVAEDKFMEAKAKSNELYVLVNICDLQQIIISKTI